MKEFSWNFWKKAFVSERYQRLIQDPLHHLGWRALLAPFSRSLIFVAKFSILDVAGVLATGCTGFFHLMIYQDSSFIKPIFFVDSFFLFTIIACIIRNFITFIFFSCDNIVANLINSSYFTAEIISRPIFLNNLRKPHLLIEVFLSHPDLIIGPPPKNNTDD